MERKSITITLLIALAFLLGIVSGNAIITGNLIDISQNGTGNYTWTKAICNEEKECIDVVITCEYGEVIGLVPISNFVDHDKDWIDPRLDEAGQLCN